MVGRECKVKSSELSKIKWLIWEGRREVGICWLAQISVAGSLTDRAIWATHSSLIEKVGAERAGIMLVRSKGASWFVWLLGSGVGVGGGACKIKTTTETEQKGVKRTERRAEGERRTRADIIRNRLDGRRVVNDGTRVLGERKIECDRIEHVSAPRRRRRRCRLWMQNGRNWSEINRVVWHAKCGAGSLSQTSLPWIAKATQFRATASTTAMNKAAWSFSSSAASDVILNDPLNASR